MPTTTLPPPRSFTLVASGDLLPHSPLQDRARAYGAGAYDFSPMFADVAPTLTAADLALCHLETPISPDDTDLSGYPLFNAPRALAVAIAGAGYDGCSTASNHSLDQGRDGAIATLDALDAAGVRHAGTARTPQEATAPVLYDAGGVTVGHLSYAYGFNGLPLPADAPWTANAIDANRVLTDAAAVRAAGAEVVVVSLHWGAEYRTAPTAEQAALAPQLLASSDVDVLLGHHAHVVQPIQRIAGEVVVYGMGNFLSNQWPGSGRSAETQDGVMVRLTFTETAPTSGRFTVTLVETMPTSVEHPSFVIRPQLPGSPSFARTDAALHQLGAYETSTPAPPTPTTPGP